MTNREFEIFVEHTRPKLLAIAHQYLSVTADAEDVVQEALLKLYAMRQRLDTYHSVDALAVVVVKRLALNVLRHEQRHHETTLDERVTSYEEPPSEERYTELLQAIDTLPSKQQMILRMKHMEGMDIAEIAELAGMSHDAIYQNLSRARRAILEQFKNRKNG
jgi:RNA polymerase sigma-70 factor (ECF subfamily)